VSSLLPASLRRAIARIVLRSPAALWTAAAVLALLTFVAVRHAASPPPAAARFGPPVPAVVLRRAVPAGIGLRARDLDVRRLPAAAVPAGSVTSRDRALGRVTLVPLFPGEILLTGRLAPAGLTGPVALLPRGHRAVAVPIGEAAPTVRPGDVVDVLATTETGTGGAETAIVAGAARVVEVAQDKVTVAVDAEEAAVVARATVVGEVSLAVRRPDE
jgi:pilus assembly protein CpaB